MTVAGARLSERLAQIERGDQVTITRRGLPIAKLVGAVPARRGAAASQRQQVGAVIASLRDRRLGVVLEGEPRDWIGDGRD